MRSELEHEIKLVEEALDDYKRALLKAANATHNYRQARARAWIAAADEKTVAAREAAVDAMVEDQRFARDLAEAEAAAALEALRARRQILSALQTISNLPID